MVHFGVKLYIFERRRCPQMPRSVTLSVYLT